MNVFGYRSYDIDASTLDEETKNLENNLKYIDDKIAYLKDRIDDFEEECDKYRGDYENIQHFIDYKKQSDKFSFECAALERICKSPYFGHMYLKDKHSDIDIFVGEQSVNDIDENNIVYDWRSPVCSLFYANQTTMTYKQNEYIVKYKRKITIENKEIINCVETYNSHSSESKSINDLFLRNILKEKKDIIGFSSIIKSIQANQNNIIRSAINKGILCQGVAGSGKTVIIIHRLSYLLFNNPELLPSQFLFIAPNDNFKSELNALNKKLDIDKIKIVTLYEYYQKKFNVIFNYHIKDEYKNRIAHIIDDKNINIEQEYSREVLEHKASIIENSILGKINEIKKQYVVNYDDDIADSCFIKCKKLYHFIKERIEKRYIALNALEKHFKPFNILLIDKYGDINNENFDFNDILVNINNELNEIKRTGFSKLLNLKGKRENRLKQKIVIIEQIKKFYDNLYAIHSKYISSLNIDIKRIKDCLESLADKIYDIDDIESDKEILNLYNYISHFNNYFDYLELVDVAADKKNKSLISNYILPRNIILQCFETICVGSYKLNTNFSNRSFYRVDIFTILYIIRHIGYDNFNDYNYIYIDEAQDYNDSEILLMKDIESNCILNIFGDYRQNISSNSITRKNWNTLYEQLGSEYNYYELKENYRNTLETVDYCNKNLDVNMRGIGVNGPDVCVEKLDNITDIVNDAIINNAIVITKNEEYYKRIVADGKIKVLYLDEAKGLEFKNVIVIDDGLTANEKYVAFTRSLLSLKIYQK